MLTPTYGGDVAKPFQPSQGWINSGENDSREYCVLRANQWRDDMGDSTCLHFQAVHQLAEISLSCIHMAVLIGQTQVHCAAFFHPT